MPAKSYVLAIVCIVVLSVSATGRREEASPAAPLRPGIYVYYDWRNLQPETYPWIVGGEMSWRWNLIESKEGVPDWSPIDRWLGAAASASKSAVIKLSPHDRQHSGVPEYVYAAGVPKVPVGASVYPQWWHPAFVDKYAAMIARFGKRYNADRRVGGVAVSIGEYGEAMPGTGGLDWRIWPQRWTAAGLTTAVWVDYNRRIVDAYVAAFPDKPLFLQEQSFPDGNTADMWAVAAYAAARGVHMGFNGLRWENDKDAHWYGPFEEYVEPGTLMGRLEQGPARMSQREVYWSVLNALRNHARIISLYEDPVRDRGNKEAFAFANRYAGKTLTTTPGVWSALKGANVENGHPGNYEFWLYQLDPAGTSVPLYDVGNDRRGMYARRTDQESGRNYLVFDVDDRFLSGGRNEVWVSVTYWDAGGDTFELRYDAVDSFENSAGQVKKDDSQTWKVAWFRLPDARFGNNLREGDLLLYSGQDGDDVFHLVEIARPAREGR